MKQLRSKLSPLSICNHEEQQRLAVINNTKILRL